MADKKIAITTSAFQGSGEAMIHAFLDHGRNKKFCGFLSTNLEDFIFIAQHAVKQMLSQRTSGSVDTPLYKNNPKDFMKALSPMGMIAKAKDLAGAVIYLTEARHVTREVLHVDGYAHAGRW